MSLNCAIKRCWGRSHQQGFCEAHYNQIKNGLEPETAYQKTGWKAHQTDSSRIIVRGDNCEIKLLSRTGEYLASYFIDVEDLESVTRWTWSLSHNSTSGKKYVYRSVRILTEKGERTQKAITLHRFLMNTPEGMVVDHIDGNGLNNKKANLRNCTQQQNMWNAKGNEQAVTKYKGVYYIKGRDRYRASCNIDGERYDFGRFKTAKEAAIAYNKNIVLLHGEYAHLNKL